jgi:predicted esterase
MNALRLLLCAAMLGTAAGRLSAQTFAPPPSQAPEEGKRRAIQERADRLAKDLMALKDRRVGEPIRNDIEVYLKAARWIAEYNEFYQKEAADWTLDALDRGLSRASQVAGGMLPRWHQEFGHAVVRGYRSALDGSIQPYAVTYPADYGKDASRKWRLDIVLHGRDRGLTEVKFLHDHDGTRDAPKDQDWVQIDIYGRGNNGYRWAGERDVFEAADNFLFVERFYNRVQLLDPQRVVLRGFSMGGAGTWHIGLHTPEQWCVLGPGAGFTTTHGYVKDLPSPLPPYQEACLHIYDAADYAENIADVPVVAYAGAADPQLQAARTIEDRLKGTGLSLKLLVAPGLKHQFPPEWQKTAQAEYARYTAQGRSYYPTHIHFVTYTLKYPECSWVQVLGLDHHYERALVDAERGIDSYTVKTSNVRQLHLTLAGANREPVAVTIDSQRLKVQPYTRPDNTLHVYLDRHGATWSDTLPERVLTDRLRRLQKIHNLQGPIDDAFTGPFLCVRGTGTPWNGAVQQYADAELKRFQETWSKYFRGELPVKDDRDINAEDLATKNLVLFGDPGSNTLIAQVLPALPLRWTRKEVSLAGKTVAAADHVPVLIYPSPLSVDHYVVLNSGHTFGAKDFQGTNALLFPRLGDYAILEPADSQDGRGARVVTAGLFDDFWGVATK